MAMKSLSIVLSVQIFPKLNRIVVMTQFLNDFYQLLLHGFLGCPHLTGKILNGTLFASHAKSLAKQ